MATLDDPIESSTSLTEETATIVAPFDPSLLTDHICIIADVLLNASCEDLQVSLLSSPDTITRCSKFATDSNNLVLYLIKETGDASSQNGNRKLRGLG
jgi:hypothetical protein